MLVRAKKWKSVPFKAYIAFVPRCYPPVLLLQTLLTMVHAVADMSDLKSQLESAGGKLVVIDFFATWCGPCKMIAPQIEEMDKTMDDVVFLKVDVDEAEDVAQEYNITAMPTFIFIKSSKKVSMETVFNQPQTSRVIVSLDSRCVCKQSFFLVLFFSQPSQTKVPSLSKPRIFCRYP